MNQGNPKGKYFKDNGAWQDGGLLFHFPSKNRWAAVFTAFQTQSFVTDDHGNPISVPPPPPPPQLGNKGGNITLLDAQGLKVDGVSYTKKDAARENELIEL